MKPRDVPNPQSIWNLFDQGSASDVQTRPALPGQIVNFISKCVKFVNLKKRIDKFPRKRYNTSCPKG